MTVAELMKILRDCDPQAQVGFAEGDVVTSIGFVEHKTGGMEAEPSDLCSPSEVFIYEEEPHWPDFDEYSINFLTKDSTFVKTEYTKLPD